MEPIDKSALVVEIKRIMDAENENINSFEQHRNTSEKQRYNARMALLEHLLSFINALEVKEADLEIEKRMKECPYRQVGCTMYEGHILECKGTCSWVADYPKLEKYKTKKGK